MKSAACIVLAIALLNILPLYSQQQKFQVSILDSRNGLSNSSVNYLFQDKDNLLWVATWDGLNLYDGSAFHVFNYNVSNKNKRSSIGNNVIEEITEDDVNNIWISTVEGISRFDKNNDSFSNFFYEQVPGKPFSEKQYQLILDKNNHLYCLSRKHGLISYNNKTDSFNTVQLNFPTREIKKASFDTHNRLWVLKENGNVIILERVNNRFQTTPDQIVPSADFTQIFSVDNNIFLINNKNDLFTLNSQTQALEYKLSLPSAVRSISAYKHHYIIGRADQGFIVLDSLFKSSGFLNKELQFLRTTQINTIIATRDESLWCGTDGSGVIKITGQQSRFQTVSNQSLGFLNNKQIRSFLEINNELWVGTKGHGILVFNKQTNPFQWNFKEMITTRNKLDNNAVYCLFKGSGNFVFIGSDGPGITIYDIRKRKFIKWNAVRGTDSIPYFGSVYSIYQDKDKSLWIGTSGFGLIHLQLASVNEGFELKSFEQFKYTGSHHGPANDVIFSIISDSKNNLLLACRYGGLSILNTASKHFNNNIKAFSYEGSLTHNDILSLFRDKRGDIWVGTSFGLNKINERGLYKDKPVFQKLTVNNGLPSNTIHGVTEDNSGFIWITTNRGVVRINPLTDEMIKYSDKDGLQSNEFSDGAIWKNSDGRLYFGGIYGFNYCIPEQIKTGGALPNVLISDFRLGKTENQPNGFWILPLTQKTAPPEYSTSKRNNFFDLKLKAIDFINAEKCEYAYKLEGYDQYWHYSGNNGNISYANLPPGIYSLKVKWSNGESKWSDEIKALDITVDQVFFLTFPAFLLYYLILVTTGYIYYTNRKHKAQMQQQLILEQQLRTKEEQLHEEKINFFTNIAHELQTPLTLMMGSLERYEFVKEQKGNKNVRTTYLSLVRQQALRLTYLVQQLLEFRKAEDGHLQKQHNRIHITSLLSNIAFLFYSNKDQKKLKFDISIEEGLEGATDKDKLEKIIYNLLSNAFKHSAAGEQVMFKVERRENYLNMEVANSGYDLSQDETERLFDKFFTQSHPTYNSFNTGIGLTFTRQLVMVLGGTIKVECKNNWITFTVSIPVDFSSLQVINESEPAHEMPSDLLQSIVEDKLPVRMPSAVDANNKQALLENLSGAEKPVVLVVDDDAGIRFLLKDILHNHYIIYEAVSGQDAILWLSKHKADIIISDIMMPDMNGLQFCETVKNTPASCHIPVVLLSARGSIDHQTEGYEAGADAYIAKPFNTQHLLVRMHKLLERRKALQEQLQQNVFAVTGNGVDYQDEDKQFLARLVMYIEENVDNPELASADLEKKCLLSKMQLYRKLKVLSGMSPGEFIRHVRLQKAAALLQSSNLSVAEIFYKTGFNNQSYFFREFRKQYNCSPNEYRETRRLGQ